MNLPKPQFDFKISIGDLIQVVLILGFIVAGYYRFDYRLSNVEKNQTQIADTLKQVSDAASKNSDTLEELANTFKAFPPHRHADHVITYPNGTVEQEPEK